MMNQRDKTINRKEGHPTIFVQGEAFTLTPISHEVQYVVGKGEDWVETSTKSGKRTIYRSNMNVHATEVPIELA